MGRTTLRAAAVITLAALFAGTATATFAAVPGEVNTPTPIEATSGRYIVLLKDAPLATYDGSTKGLEATKPGKGNQLDARSAKSQKYVAHLKKKQDAVAATVTAGNATTYQVTLNGFSADLSGEDVAKLRANKDVLSVYADEIRHPDAAMTGTEFLGLGANDTGAGGVWDAVGGVSEAGKGIVVGVVDTGIASANPSFAGAKLSNRPGAEPYLDGDDVVFNKADGTQFRASRVGGQNWSKQQAYSTKLIGGQFFSAGAKAAGFKFTSDFLSPQDGDGHGSHTASTAAGNFGVAASVEGVDFGTISGVAPAAKVSSYKACWSGPDPLDNQDDICALSDLLGAIDKAVLDGVDVINYSIGGGSATSVLQPDDISFFNAAAAGVYIAVSAGNSGPDASTADHAAPWYTTVAASTIPTYEGTVELDATNELFAGASVSVPFGTTVTGASVYSGDIPAAGAAAADAALCLPGTLDAAVAAGKIVVCDRGVNARVEKSLSVAQAGGIGMVLTNVTAGSLDNDFHSVPTVHVQSTARDAILAYVRAGADQQITLHSENITGIETPTPVVAGFSSRGPMLADGSDVIKPDVSAPGVAILAATQSKPNKPSTFGFLSGTSMSSPHVAGLGALYLGERPKASPAEVKSALMTTAYNTVNADGLENTDPFAQGAGHVDPTKYFSPGLVYDNGLEDWANYLQGLGLFDFGLEGTDASDLNLASIGIGSLSGPQTVTRSVTSTQAGTFTATAEVAGVDVVVEPRTLTFGAAGETKSFTVTFTKADAAAEEWATGFLTWTSGATQVRSPLAVFPITADAPALVEGSGATGSVDIEITAGLTGELPLNLSGLAPVEVLVDGNESTGADADGYTYTVVEVAEGTDLAHFAIDSSDDTGSDMDLFVYHVVSADDLSYYEMWTSASGSADELVEIEAPTAGTYLVESHVYSYTAPFTWQAKNAIVADGAGEGTLTATPNPLAVTQGETAQFTVSWAGLAAGEYLGTVRYGDSQVRTVLSVTAE